MFFRCKQSPSGRCHQLLESCRNAQSEPRHRVVVSLGDATIAEADRPRIARLVEQRLRGQTELQCVSDGAGLTACSNAGTVANMKRESKRPEKPEPKTQPETLQELSKRRQAEQEALNKRIREKIVPKHLGVQ